MVEQEIKIETTQIVITETKYEICYEDENQQIEIKENVDKSVSDSLEEPSNVKQEQS